MRNRCIPTRYFAFISAAKNELKNPKEYLEMVAGFFMEKVSKIYPLYQRNSSKTMGWISTTCFSTP